MLDPSATAWHDQDAAWMVDTVRRCGWAIRYVNGDECDRPGCRCAGHDPAYGPPFGYTVGLYGLGHPELLVLGLSRTDTARLLNTLGARVRGGDNLLPGVLLSFDGWPHRVVPERIPNPGEVVFDANHYYQRPPEYSVEVLQLSYDDRQGRFPWEDGCSHPGLQPRPGTFRA